MPEISNYDISCYIAIGLGLLILIAMLFVEWKIEELSATGEKAEGVIFDTERKSNFYVKLGSMDDFDDTTQTATVRFVTKKLEWITAEINNATSLTVPYRQGTKVNVFYNPENPYDFVVTPTRNHEWKKWLFIIAGVLLIAGGVLFLLFKF